MKGVSVVICCFNSQNKLISTLTHLAKQHSLPGLNYEIILVDNNCTDNTIEIAFNAWTSLHSPFPFRVVKQTIPGLNYARDMGIKNALYEYVVLCDDDNWLNVAYLLKVYQLFETLPAVGLIGGVGEALFETPPPPWFNELKGFGYAVGAEGRKTGNVNSAYGAGLAIRKSVYEAVSNSEFAFLLSDRKGKNLSSGGDTEITILIKKSGYFIYFDSSLKFKHYLSSNRLQWKYYLKLRQSFGKASAYLQLYDAINLSQQSLQKKNSIIQTMSLIKFAILHWKYLFFFNHIKNANCADFTQQLSMRLTMLMNKKKMRLITNQLTKTLIKEKERLQYVDKI